LAPREGTLYPSFIPEAQAGGRIFYLCIAFLRVMRGLDPRICRWHEIAGSSPAMTKRKPGHDEKREPG
jgi:hypothetical protein